jgi:SpoIID/LytB domain protein
MEDIFKHLDICLEQQLNVWPAAREAFSNLEQVQTRVLSSSGLALQHNPARIISTTANVKPAQITRACFLCHDNRPQEQIAFDADDGFDLLVNPYPILKEHFCVVSREHRLQTFRDCYKKMLKIAQELEPGYMIFYNGPRSGASAPDHLHMQIGRSEGIPLVDKLRLNNPPKSDEPVTIQPFGFPVIVIKGDDPDKVWDCVSGMSIYDGDYEPRMNVLSFNRDGQVITAIIPRSKHRPDCYYADGADKITVSPGAVDMFGLVITPRREDFDRLTERRVLDIYRQVTPQQPKIKVGIMAAPEISFCLNDSYTDGRSSFEGEMSISAVQGRLSWNGILIDSLTLKPHEHGSTFTLHNVTIGIGFHWERREEQTFSGQLRFIVENGMVRAINILPIEEYLTSVISSEMKPTASREFLRAHAVISRSWVLAQLRSPYSKAAASADSTPSGNAVDVENGSGVPYGHILKRIIKWYDHDQHTLFDVCADDHCQRYQGRTRIISAAAQQAVRDTMGQTLTYDGHLCDARFSKCCGGVTEQFQTCWQDEHKPYLIALRDSSVNEGPLPDLTIEENARQWILQEPKSFCNSADGNILKESLNGYDLETPDYYRWKVEYTVEQISDIFRRKSGLDIGDIVDLRPIKRGPSGRIYELEIEGTKGTVTIGKELEIRRTLSESHLFSSAFVVEKTTDENGNFNGFILHGAGWGHGAGLCQIGAAVMATKGYTYREILEHYYPGTSLGRFY